MDKNKYSDEEVKNIIIEEYKNFAKKLGKTPKQKDIKEERKNNPNWIITIHKISYYFNSLFELNEICKLTNYSKNKKQNKHKKTHEEFIKEVEKIVGDKYEFLTEYKGADKNITIKCKKDEHIWTINANGFLKHGCKCPKCSNCVKNKDTEYFKNEVSELYTNNEYTVLGEYINSKENILLKHNLCNNEFSITPDSFLNKHAECPICSHRKGADKLFLTHTEFINKIKEKYKDNFQEYEILSQYKGYKEYVKVKHLKCGNTYEQNAGDMLQGKKCKFCCGTLKKTQEEFEQEIKDLYNGEYTVIGKYINCKSSILIKHNICGCTEEYLIDNLLNEKTSCPNCSKDTKGEYQIRRFLKYNNLNYKQQYIFKDLKDKDYLRFDNSLLNDKKELLCLIEFDGIQHTKPVQFGGISKEKAIEQFENTKYKDNLKNQYCKNKKIPLLRISYLDFNNINEILQSYLDKNFNIKTKIPSYNFMIWKDDISLKFIELFDKLPNGIYPKDLIYQKLNKEKPIHDLLKIKSIKEYIKKNNILIDNQTITIINNEFNYIKYFGVIKNYKLRYGDKIIKILKILYDMPLGKYFKGEIKEIYKLSGNSMFSPKYFNNNFMQQFLIDNKIIISHNQIFKNN